MPLFGWFVDPKSTDYCVPCKYEEVSEPATTAAAAAAAAGAGESENNIDGDSNAEACVQVELLAGDNAGTTTQTRGAGDSKRSNKGSFLVPFDSHPFEPKADLIHVASLTEAAILHNLRVRYHNDEIYTSIGDILISVNPFKQLRLYTPSVLAQYLHVAADAMGVPPHIYGSAMLAYDAMVNDHQNQSLVISGESGAGKTECMKLLLQFLTEKSRQLSGGQDAKAEATSPGSRASVYGARDLAVGGLEQRVLAANPILEAFGNSTTVRNHNSSRFGKWTAISFDDLTGNIRGCSITPYLLEKSRVAYHGVGERNYHIFYQLLAIAAKDDVLADRLNFSTTKPSAFYYLQPQGSASENCDGHEFDDAWHAKGLQDALDLMHFSEQDKLQIFGIVAAVLHVGNIHFNTVEASSGDTAAISDNVLASVDAAANLLGLPTQELAAVLTQRNLGMGGVKVPYDVPAAEKARDALAKALYEKLFLWIVGKLNHKFTGLRAGAGVQSENGLGAAGSIRSTSIGVLDIFGFEDFEHNHFEQLCINFCNEKLHFFFNDYVFRIESALYASEGIDIGTGDAIGGFSCAIDSNRQCIALFETPLQGKKLGGVFSLLEDELRLPGKSDEGYTSKLNKLIKLRETKASSTGSRARKGSRASKGRGSDASGACSSIHFVIQHYAGSVKYSTAGFLERAVDRLHVDVRGLLGNSSNRLVQQLFQGETSSTQSSRKQLSLGTQFKQQLSALLAMLGKTNPNFVRCLKPNDNRQANEFNAHKIMKQLRELGLVGVCHIRRTGFPRRVDFETFLYRYDCCGGAVSQLEQSPRLRCVALVSSLNSSLFQAGSGSQLQVGKSLVFMRQGAEKVLEKARAKALSRIAILIQKVFRGHCARKAYLLHKKAVARLQKAVAAQNPAAIRVAVDRALELDFVSRGDKLLRFPERLYDQLKAEIRVCDALELSIQNNASSVTLKRLVQEGQALLKSAQTIASESGIGAGSGQLFAPPEASKRLTFTDLRAALEKGKRLLEEQVEMDTLFRAIAAALDAWDERGIQLYLSNIEKSKRSNKLPVALEDVVRLAKQRINVVEHVRNANTTLRTFLETATESASGFDSASEATLRNAIQNHINALFDPADVGEDGDTAKPQQQAQLAISCNARRRKSNIDGQAQGCVASQALRVEFQSAISWIRDSKLVSDASTVHEEALQRLSSLLVARDTMLKLQLEKQTEKEDTARVVALKEGDTPAGTSQAPENNRLAQISPALTCTTDRGVPAPPPPASCSNDMDDNTFDNLYQRAVEIEGRQYLAVRNFMAAELKRPLSDTEKQVLQDRLGSSSALSSQTEMVHGLLHAASKPKPPPPRGRPRPAPPLSQSRTTSNDDVSTICAPPPSEIGTPETPRSPTRRREVGEIQAPEWGFRETASLWIQDEALRTELDLLQHQITDSSHDLSQGSLLSLTALLSEILSQTMAPANAGGNSPRLTRDEAERIIEKEPHFLSKRLQRCNWMRRLKIVAPGTRRSAMAQPALCLFSLQGWELTYFDKAMPEAGDALEIDAPSPLDDQTSQVMHEEVMLNVGGAMARCIVLEIKTMLSHPELARAARLRLEQSSTARDADPDQSFGQRAPPTIVEVELAPRLNKIGIRLNADTLQVQVKPDSVCAAAGVKDGMYLVTLRRSDDRRINVEGHTPMQVLRIIRAWSAYTRFLIFSSEQGGNRAREDGAISGSLEPQNSSGLIQQQLGIAGVAVPELWVKRYYVPYGGTQRRVRLCIHIDSGLAETDESLNESVAADDNLLNDPPPPFPGLSDSGSEDDSTDYYDDEGNVKRPQKLRLDDLGVRDSVSLEPGRRCVSTKTFDQINRRPSGVSPLARAANDLVTAKASSTRGELDADKDLVFDTRSSEECDAWYTAFQRLALYIRAETLRTIVTERLHLQDAATILLDSVSSEGLLPEALVDQATSILAEATKASCQDAFIFSKLRSALHETLESLGRGIPVPATKGLTSAQLRAGVAIQRQPSDVVKNNSEFGFHSYRALVQLSNPAMYFFHNFPLLRETKKYAKAASVFEQARARKKMLLWQDWPIPTSLTSLNPATAKVAVLMFRNVLGYCGEAHHPYPDTLAEDIIVHGLNEPQLQDELFCQLMKQLSGNSKRRRPESYSRAWALMCLLLRAFSPSKIIIRYLTNFLRFSAEVPRDLKHRLKVAQHILKQQVHRLLSANRSHLEPLDVSNKSEVALFASKIILEVKQKMRKTDLVAMRRSAVAANHE